MQTKANLNKQANCGICFRRKIKLFKREENLFKNVAKSQSSSLSKPEISQLSES